MSGELYDEGPRGAVMAYRVTRRDCAKCGAIRERVTVDGADFRIERWSCECSELRMSPDPAMEQSPGFIVTKVPQ